MDEVVLGRGSVHGVLFFLVNFRNCLSRISGFRVRVEAPGCKFLLMETVIGNGTFLCCKYLVGFQCMKSFSFFSCELEEFSVTDLWF